MILLTVVFVGLVSCDSRVDVLPDLEPEHVTSKSTNSSTPPEFDWRQVHPKCVREASTPGDCAASYAHVAAGVASDRSCVQGQKDIFDVGIILTCCAECGAGCYGGYPWKALSFLKKRGTGNRDCINFPILTSSVRAKTPFCRPKMCTNNTASFKLLKIKDFYLTKTIEGEIFSNGPVLSYMDLHSDLFNYTTGIYLENGSPKLGRITVKLLGWGEEGGNKFWIAENSWGKDWGTQGYFKILKGTNFCNIEQFVFGLNIEIK